MLDHEQREPALAEPGEPLHETLDLRSIQPGRRLVRHQEPRPCGERPRNLQHPLRSVGERAGDHAGAVRQPDEGQELTRLLAEPGAVAAIGAAVENVLPGRDVVMDVEARQDVVEDGEVPEEPDLLERAGEPQARAPVGGKPREVHGAEPHPAGVGRGDPVQEIEERRFPGAVGADQSEDGAPRDLERDRLHGLDAAEPLGQRLGAEEAVRVMAGGRRHAGAGPGARRCASRSRTRRTAPAMPPGTKSTTSVRETP